MPHSGYWRELLNSDASEYGGTGVGNLGGVQAEEVPQHGTALFSKAHPSAACCAVPEGGIASSNSLVRKKPMLDCVRSVPMRILTRYILREVSSHALIGAGIFTFVLFTRDLGRILEMWSGPAPRCRALLKFSLHGTARANLYNPDERVGRDPDWVEPPRRR